MISIVAAPASRMGDRFIVTCSCGFESGPMSDYSSQDVAHGHRAQCRRA